MLKETSQIIADLIRQADEQFETLTSSESQSLADAAKAYRSRRGRHPPPGFDAWYQFAKESNSLVIESFFDTIYDNLEPYWGILPQQTRDFASTWPTVVKVRNGEVSRPSGKTNNASLSIYYYSDILENLPNLPDVTLAINGGDEPQVIVPFNQMIRFMEEAEKSRSEHNTIPLSDIKKTFPSQPDLLSVPDELPETQDYVTGDQGHWNAVVNACRPDDPIHTEPGSITVQAIPPKHSKRYTKGSIQGYISNYTIARNVCWNPNLRSLHGYFIHPWAGISYTELRPIFSAANVVDVSHDIIIPPPAHWMKDGIYKEAEQKIPWKEKKSATGWWGSATGGNHTADNWWGFHRHRWVQLLNGTAQSILEKQLEQSPYFSTQELYEVDLDKSNWGKYNFPYPLRELFPDLGAFGKFGLWIGNVTNGGFTNMFCSMQEYYESVIGKGPKTCKHTDDYYGLVDLVNADYIMKHKYLPDVDGHGASGRFVGFVRSLSVPIKSTIFTEWHDSRLIPWRHFVPMSPEYQEWYGLLQYFLGYKDEKINIPDHDDMGEKIGRQGSEWTARAERREDLLVYVHRLILEYARVCADERISMGWVDDLLDKT